MLKVAVNRIQEVAEDVLELSLQSEGPELVPAEPGSHIDVSISSSLVRPYSVLNPGDTGKYQIAVQREANGRGGSRFLHDQVSLGHRVEIGQPKNNFPLVEDALYSLLVCGGIGVTPILAMARTLYRSDRPFKVLQFARSEQRLAYAKELKEIATEYIGVIGASPEETRQALEPHVGEFQNGIHIYSCGPSPFLDLVSSVAAHWPRENQHQEFFAAPPSNGTPTEDAPFEIQIADTGLVVDVGASETAIEALTRHGIEVDTSCEQGVCGTCAVGLVSGDVDHRDIFQTEQEKSENSRFFPCVSRARGPRLVIEISADNKARQATTT